MSLALLQNVTAVGSGIRTPFEAIGGAEPYVYSVRPGGAGGTINASSGLYTAPAGTGSDTVRVTDDDGVHADADILVCSPLGLVCDIIQRGMALADGQVFLWDQKINIPPDSRLYVAVGVLSSKPFANTRTMDGSGSGLSAIQSINVMDVLSIDIFSRGPEARDRKEEILLALNSQYAEQQQEANSFRVFQLSTGFQNISDVEGAAIPYRFSISVNMQYFKKKVTAVSYFDQFEDTGIETNP